MDIKTIIICLIFLNFALATFMLVFVKVHKTYPGFIYWSMSNMMVVVSYILLSLRGMTHDFLSIVVANTCVVLAGILKILGARQFFGRKRLHSLFIIAVAMFFLMGFFTHFTDNPDARVFIMTFFLVSAILYLTYLVLKTLPQEGRLTYIIAGGIFIVYGAFAFLRGFEWLFLSKQGFLFNSSLFNTIYFMYLFIFDISWATLFLIMNHQRLSHELVQKNSALEETNKIKDRFFAILAHDLKNPFSGIIALSDLLLINIGKKDINKIQESLKVIKNTAEQTYSLLSNLLNWAKTQIGAAVFNPDQYNLRDLLEDTIAIVKTIADLKNIQIQNNINDSTMVYVDEDMINIVLRNLLMNAIKFSYRNSVVNIDAQENNGLVILSIKDSGIGISAQDIKKLFKPGEIIATKGTDSEQGSGLGLLLCKEYITINFGEIWVNSEPGKGSCFNISMNSTKTREN